MSGEVFEEAPELDGADPDEANDRVVVLSVDEVVVDSEDVDVLDELEVELTVEVIVN